MSISNKIKYSINNKDNNYKIENYTLSEYLEQIFNYCKLGELSNLDKLLNTYPFLLNYLNIRHYCIICNTRMELTPLQIAAAYGQANIISYFLNFQSYIPYNSTISNNNYHNKRINNLTNLNDIERSLKLKQDEIYINDKQLFNEDIREKSDEFINFNITDTLFGMTALHLAVHLHHLEVISLLCSDHRIDLSERTLEGKTALHMLIERGNTEGLKKMLTCSTNINMYLKDFDGNTPLHAACKYPNKEIFIILYDYLKNKHDFNKLKNKREVIKTNAEINRINNSNSNSNSIRKKSISDSSYSSSSNDNSNKENLLENYIEV